MSWLSWIVVGFLAGMGAKAVTGQRGRRGLGCLATVVVGILGGLLGGALFQAAGDEGINDFSVRSVLIAFVGACVLLFLAGRFGGRRFR